MANFNIISPFYDQLAHLVFGDTLEKATCHFLPTLQPNQKILVMGGGNGQVLLWLDALRIPLEVTYVEISGQMMSNSRKKGPFQFIKVHYVQEDATGVQLKEIFDVVLFPFNFVNDEDAFIERTTWK